MSFDRDKHHRRSIRLSGFDYSSPGAYFVTLCAYDRERIFGAVAGGEVRLSDYGRVAREEWLRSATVRPEIELDAFVIMPNHIHGVVIITGHRRDDKRGSGKGRVCVGAQGLAPLHRPPRSLGSFVAGFKMAVTKRVNTARGRAGARVGQRNYYERVVRDDGELALARWYIRENPARWPEDDYYRP